MSRNWTIGSSPDCDLVVNVPQVSGRHCRLTLLDDAYFLEDLGSTNGTYVNGERVNQRLTVSRADSITLGLSAMMPWPADDQRNAFKVLTIGRDFDNDIVVNQPIVSGRHARIIWEGNPEKAIIEDLGSSNGTSIQTFDQKITQAPFHIHDLIYLGTYPLLGAHLLACLNPSSVSSLDFLGDSLLIGRDPACPYTIDLPTVSSRHARLFRSDQRLWIEDLGSSNGTFVNAVRIEGRTEVKPGDILGFGGHVLKLSTPNPRVIPYSPPPIPQPTSRVDSVAAPGPMISEQAKPRAPIAVAPLSFGAIFVAPWKKPTQWISLLMLAPVAALLITLALRGSVESVPAILFWTGFAAFGFGLCDVIASRSPSVPRGIEDVLASFCSLGLLGLIQCFLIWLMIFKLTSLDIAWLPALGLLALGTGVGLAAGLLIVSVAPKPAAAVAIGIGLLLGAALFGEGGTRTPEAARMVSSGLPTRWIYEGLLLLNTDQGHAEAEFPAASERMGLGTDVLALALMLVGLSAGAAFISTVSPPGRPA